MNLRTPDMAPITEAEHANWVLAADAIAGLKEALSGQFVSDKEFDEALGITPVR